MKKYLLKRVLVDGGYIENNVYHFYQTDHLGNNRVVANQSGTPIQKNHYYPFGMAFAEGTAQEQGKQPYKYNGKELDQLHGLNLYDYSARYMDAAIGRFTTVDPLAEQGYSWSPYAYCFNNPLLYTDPNGEWPFPSWETIKTVGRIIRDIAVEATEAKVTVGLQVKAEVKLSAVNVGANVNFVSTDVTGYSNGEFFYPGKETSKARVEFVKQGVDIDAGIIHFGVKSAGVNENNQLTKEKTIYGGVSVFEIEHKETTPLDSKLNPTGPKQKDTRLKATDIEVNAAAIIGLDLKLDTGKVWEILGRHLLDKK